MSVTERSLRPVSLPRLRAMLPHRRPAPLYETVIVEPEVRNQELLVTLVLALAPMTFSFLYLFFIALRIF